MPEGCAAIVQRAMAKLPEDRYQTATEMLRDLEALLADKPEMDNVQEWNDMVAAAQTLTTARGAAPPRPASGVVRPASGVVRPSSGVMRPMSGIADPADGAPMRPAAIIIRKKAPAVPIWAIAGGAVGLLALIIVAVLVFRGGGKPADPVADAKKKKDDGADRIPNPPDRTPDPPDRTPDPKPDPVPVSTGDAWQKELDELSTAARISRDKADPKALAAAVKSLTAFRDTHRTAADSKRHEPGGIRRRADPRF